MPEFNFQTARARRALLAEKVFSSATRHRIILALFAIFVVVAAISALAGASLRPRLYVVLLLDAIAIYLLWAYSLFYSSFWSNFPPPAEGEQNLANFLDVEAAGAIDKFLKKDQKDISALLLPMLKLPGAAFVWYRLGVAPQKLEGDLRAYLTTVAAATVEVGSQLQLLIQDAFEQMRAEGTLRLLTWRDLLVALCVHSEFLRRYIFELKLEKKDITAVCAWQQRQEQSKKLKKQFWQSDNLMRTRGIGKDWSAGFTVNLDKFARDVTGEIAKTGFARHLFGRTEETEAIERILSRAGENNVVIVGEEGVGKKTIVYALADRILHGQTLPPLAHKRVLRLDVGAVLAGAKSEHEIEQRLKVMLNEAVNAGNVILMIEDIHALFESSAGVGSINATELLLPYFDSSQFQVIGLTTYQGYQATISRNSSLLRAFQKVEIHEPTKNTVYDILEEVVPQIEAHNQVLILYQSMKRAVDLADRYIKTVPFPEKAIDLLQEAAVYAQTKGRSSVVLPDHLEEVVHQKTEIPVGKIALAEKEVLLDLEKILHRKVIAQDEAIKALSNALRRARSGIASEKKPIGSFLFLGPTGVGKTETAKALAEVYFGSEKRMIRFDMSEYQQPESLGRLIGHDDEPGQLTSDVMESPFSLLLFDEVEKAHPNILNLFLQVLDDGRLTDALGRTVDFTNTIIIFTSNAGAELIRQAVLQFHEENLKERLLDHLQKSAIFKPEFLNRFDAVIVYKPLSEEQTQAVVELLLADLNRRLKAAQDIQVTITPELTKKLAHLGYNPEFGARPLRRAIQDKVETVIAAKLLSGEIKRGDIVQINPEEL